MGGSFINKAVILLFLVFMSQCFAATSAEDSQKNMLKEMQGVMNKPIYKYATWGVLIKDLDSGKIIYQQNQDKMFRPASTTKLFTAAAALKALGPDYRYKTYVYRKGNIDKDGVLDGDIILVASGDLTMGWRNVNDKIVYTDFDHTDANILNVTDKFLLKYDPATGLDDLAKQIAAQGIKHIRGDVIIDDRLFAKSKPSENDDMIRTPIVINDNIIDFVIKPGKAVGDPAVFSYRPDSKYYQIDSQVNTVAQGQGNQFNGHIIEPNILVIRGQIALDAPAYLKIYDVNDPSSFARSLFITSLQKAGIRIEASALAPNPQSKLPAKSEYNSLSKVASLTSPPLSENIKLILKVSHNLGAELLPLQLAAKNGKSTFEDGIILEKKYLNELGLDTSAISIGDGMGGSKSDLFTPEAVVQLLTYMHKTPYFNEYLNALPILGIDASLDGTLDNKTNSPAKGNVFAKSGTSIGGDELNQRAFLFTQGLAGYIKISPNKFLAYTLYVNHVALNSIDQSLDVARDLGKISEIIYDNNVRPE